MLVGISETIRVLLFNFLQPSLTLNEAKQSFQSFRKLSSQNYSVTVLKKNMLRSPLKTSTLRVRRTIFFSSVPSVPLVPSLRTEGVLPRAIFKQPSQSKAFSTKTTLSDPKFNQWLAGLIDGDGCFQLSKKGYASLEIIMETRDKHCLYQIKQKFGGSVKLQSSVNWVRYRLHHKTGLLDLINAVNGEIRNPVKLIQLNKIAEKYNISVIQPSVLTYNNAWFSGFFDSDGSVYLNPKSSQMFITASQKNKYILDQLPNKYGGKIYIQKDSFKWVVYQKAEIIKLLDYFKLCPSRSAKHNRLKAITKYHELRDLKAHLASDNSILGKAWKKFVLKWDKWEKID